MVNWQKFKIIEAPRGSLSYTKVWVDRDIDWRDGKGNCICFPNRSPYSNYQVGDYLEIDLDEACRCWGAPLNIDDSSIVRRASSSTNIITSSGSSSDIVVSPGVVNAMGSTRAMELARYMSRMVDENDKEYELKIEDNTNPRFTYSLICRKQK